MIKLQENWEFCQGFAIKLIEVQLTQYDLPVWYWEVWQSGSKRSDSSKQHGEVSRNRAVREAKCCIELIAED